RSTAYQKKNRDDVKKSRVAARGIAANTVKRRESERTIPPSFSAALAICGSPSPLALYFLMTRLTGAAVAATSRPWCLALPAIVRAAWPTFACGVSVSVTFTSFWLAAMFFTDAVTPGGKPAALSAISAVKPGARVAVTVSVAGLPGMYDGAS